MGKTARITENILKRQVIRNAFLAAYFLLKLVRSFKHHAPNDQANFERA